MSHAGIVQDLIAWIEANLEQPLDIDHVAERTGFSKWYLQRMFKHHTGYPLANYIRRRRLSESACRLATSNEAILSVALAVGFDSQQSFSRSFKREYGESPGMYRRMAGKRQGGIPPCCARPPQPMQEVEQGVQQARVRLHHAFPPGEARVKER